MLLKEIKALRWVKIFFPMLLSLGFSRMLAQTDLYFLRTFPKTIILLSFFSQVSIFDSILALAIVPTCLITVSHYRSYTIQKSLIPLAWKCGLITACISAIISIVLCFVLTIHRNLSISFREFSAVLIVIVLTIPFRWLQISTTSLLHLKKKGHIVVIISFTSIFINYILDYWLLHIFGYIGCLLATLLVTMITSIGCMLCLHVSVFRNNYHIQRALFRKSKNNIYKEFSRIVLLKIGMGIVYSMILTHSNNPAALLIILQFSIIFECNNLIAIIPISSYRTTVILGKSTYREKLSYAFFTTIFIVCLQIILHVFLPYLITMYGLNGNSGIFTFYVQTVVFLLIADSLVSFFRAEMQIKNKFIHATIVETIVVYVFLIPFIMLSLHLSHYYMVITAFILTNVCMALGYCIAYYRKKRLTR